MKNHEVGSVSSLEISTIQPIPLSERHGRPRDLFTIWFGTNITLLTVMTGSLGVSMFHLSFLWGCLAALIGNLVGAIFMALHSAQGPRLGVPQMVQTRGQFGSWGSVLVVALVVVMYLGFMSSNLVFGGESLHVIFPSVPTDVGIIIVSVMGLAAASFGYNLIHAYTRVMSWLSGLLLLLSVLWIIFIHGLPADFLQRNSGFHGVGFLGTISVSALWQLAFAPYVSDYSRYMPDNLNDRSVFYTSYFGCVLGSFLPMVLGIMVSTCVNTDDLLQGVVTLTGGLSTLVVVVFGLGIAATNSMDLYCSVLCSLTLGQTFFPQWSPKARARIITALIAALIAVYLATAGKDNFLVNYTNFLLMLLYVLVPWTSINLVDYYLVNHGNYDVASFFRQDGGIYGYFNWNAVFCYLLGIVIEVPFMATALYTGPAARALGGADISWLVGLVVVSPIYYFFDKYRAPRPGTLMQ